MFISIHFHAYIILIFLSPCPKKPTIAWHPVGRWGGEVIPRRCNCENISKDCFCIGIIFADQITEEPVDLSVFSPACLPHIGASHVGLKGHVFGECH